MNIKIKKLNEKAIIPTRATAYSAGYDLYACIETPVEILPKNTKKIGTGLAMSVPIGYAGFIYARSGLATKQGLRPSNCVGIADSDYTGEYIVALYNDSSETRIVNNGDRISQLVIAPIVEATWQVVDELDNTERGNGGFGSTGVK